MSLMTSPLASILVPQALTQPVTQAAPDIEQQMKSEWAQAQDFYNKRVSAGDVEPDEADQIYFAPLRAKWGVVANDPDLQTDPKRFSAFNQDFNKALQSYNSANQRNEIGDNAKSAFKRTLEPVIQQQTIANALDKNTQDDYDKNLTSVLGGSELENLDLSKMKPSQVGSLMSAYRLKHPTKKESEIDKILQKIGAGANAGLSTTSTNTPGIKILSIKKVQ